jgi:poly(3-hydroxybutyrate) depolymerase
MNGRRKPTRGQIRARRVTALLILAAAVAVVLLVVSALASGPETSRDGYHIVDNEVKSKAVGGRELGYNVLVPPKLPKRGHRSLLIYLHGRGGDEGTFNEEVLRGITRLHGHGPLVVFPAGGVHGYWHNRAEGRWEDWVMKEVLPRVVHQYGVDTDKIAIGGISMGGFGAYDIALKNPGTFCAVGGHSPALWFKGGETAPGAFESAADFERNDVVGTVQANPDALGKTKVWIDYGEEDPFRPYDEGFVAALSEGDTHLSAHSWPGGHEGSYWGAHWPDYQRWYVKQLASC